MIWPASLTKPLKNKRLYMVFFAPRIGPEANSKAPEETATQEVTNFLEVCKLKL